MGMVLVEWYWLVDVQPFFFKADIFYDILFAARLTKPFLVAGQFKRNCSHGEHSLFLFLSDAKHRVFKKWKIDFYKHTYHIFYLVLIPVSSRQK